MTNNRMYKVLGVVLVGVMLALGYGGFCKSSSSSDSGSSTVKHIAVDPYIVGAKFFEDLNKDGVQDSGEQISTESDANGIFTFSRPLSTGAIVVLSDTAIGPLHNGISYTGTVKRKVDSTGTLVCSPLTTLLANGWREIDIIEALSNAGLAGFTGLTVPNIKENPMEGMDVRQTLSDATLVKIRASIAVHSFMKIMDTLIAGQGYNITPATFASTPEAITALQKAVITINNALSPGILANIQLAMSSAPISVTAGDVIKTSVAIVNYVTSKVAANINYNLDLNQINALGLELGVNFYVIRNKDNPLIGTIITAINNSAMAGVLISDVTLNVTACNSLIVSPSGVVESVPVP